MQEIQPASALIIGDEILTGTRVDAHFPWLAQQLPQRGMRLLRVQYVTDAAKELRAVLENSFASGVTTFCFGGIGGTPDDRTRQCAAQALGLELARHPEAVAMLERRFGAEAYPTRIRMTEFPVGSGVIPNPINQIPGFHIRNHYFYPGFPQMAQPMLEWTLEALLNRPLRAAAMNSRVLWIAGLGESALVAPMEAWAARFPQLEFTSLPMWGAQCIELGVRGVEAEAMAQAWEVMRAHLTALGIDYADEPPAGANAG
ncbi:competence/damage-inducible protein A [Magnetofaba australis]|uniref:Putative molybdopterin binding domain-containing protein n=1 Tax=Magnetofaba australis IT-1 TaxID=1434232 RepID=A0A1Y2K784_9PROT|nr:competence/damage-inducible protein A [Magnetofaba australis]OSM05177.1 putative molybdopterin binding domain-containing protein [Magnetofaba australis IT-1]